MSLCQEVQAKAEKEILESTQNQHHQHDNEKMFP